uniref:NADH-ubiquinone oxidoreductase chain 5 n=1 Tax=Coleoptera sp. ACP-2013 TaxID=2485033 RepID=A0A3G3MEI1_9COLE|nr:NADH dehydrogenase subunit 5 [Coleoptera sp. ACP-2013]
MSICILFFFTFLMFSISLFFTSIYFMIKNYSILLEYNLMSMNSSNISGIILMDWMSTLFMSFVLFISSMVIFYSEDYMKGDLNINRFILLVVMFVLSMMMLIMSPNLISILIGWDGLGLISYCLVIYYQNVKSFNAGMITALSNRIGDVAIILSIAWMLNFGSWNFIYYLNFFNNDLSMKFIMWLVVLAAFTKSAQIPFSSWLPAAMAAPTPVSSLVHSSTLVTAGVYILIRFSPVLSDYLMMTMLFISSMTMFMAGLGANFEFDLKKIIAFSTLSQLGFMMSILFLGNWKLSFFHLLTHALFKALLFMCAGNMIHNLSSCQDIRFMGSLINQLPLTCSFFCISSLALAGIPFLSGSYSKELILGFFSMTMFNMYMYIIFFVSIGLTACYSARLFYYLLWGNFNFYSINSIKDNSKMMLKGMGGLLMFVVTMGSGLSWLMMDSIYFIMLPNFLKFMTLFMIMMGFQMGVEISKFSISYYSKTMNFPITSNFFSTMWNMPLMSTGMIIKIPLIMGSLLIKNFDQGWVESLGSQGIYYNLKKNSSILEIIFNNHLKIFLMLMIMVLFLIMI